MRVASITMITNSGTTTMRYRLMHLPSTITTITKRPRPCFGVRDNPFRPRRLSAAPAAAVPTKYYRRQCCFVIIPWTIISGVELEDRRRSIHEEEVVVVVVEDRWINGKVQDRCNEEAAGRNSINEEKGRLWTNEGHCRRWIQEVDHRWINEEAEEDRRLIKEEAEKDRRLIKEEAEEDRRLINVEADRRLINVEADRRLINVEVDLRSINEVCRQWTNEGRRWIQGEDHQWINEEEVEDRCLIHEEAEDQDQNYHLINEKGEEEEDRHLINEEEDHRHLSNGADQWTTEETDQWIQENLSMECPCISEEDLRWINVEAPWITEEGPWINEEVPWILEEIVWTNEADS
jgi:hypothetical protein